MFTDVFHIRAQALRYARDRMDVDPSGRTKHVISELLKQAERFHLIFNRGLSYVVDVPWGDDDNGGIPDWVFSEEFPTMEVNLTDDTIEWVPNMGPAPIWKDTFSKFKTTDEIITAFKLWYQETY